MFLLEFIPEYLLQYFILSFEVISPNLPFGGVYIINQRLGISK
jgi:hypothetical protein